MLQWFIRFPEFAEFNENSAPFRKNSNIGELVGVVLKSQVKLGMKGSSSVRSIQNILIVFWYALLTRKMYLNHELFQFYVIQSHCPISDFNWKYQRKI